MEGTCRSAEKQEVLRIRGFAAHRFNPDDDEGLRWDPTPLEQSWSLVVGVMYLSSFRASQAACNFASTALTSW